jgi:hypothetical protein
VTHEDTGGGPDNSVTGRNTSTDWLGDMKPVDLNLHGLADYAKNLKTISDNLASHQTRVFEQMREIVPVAFQGGFPEIQESSRVHAQNLGEFGQYLRFLAQAVLNVGSAAQTVADSYHSSDGWSAASLDAVKFAFGDPNAKRPSGLPSWVPTTTWLDGYLQQQAQAAQQGGQQANWVPAGTTTDPATGKVTMTYTDNAGHTKTITVEHVGNETITTTTTPQGTTVVTSTTSTYPYGSVTTKTTRAPNGQVTTTTEETYSSSNTSTTTYLDDKGRTTSTTTTTYNADGSQTVTTKSYDDKGKEHTQSQITYGQESPGVGNRPDSPGVDATNQLNDELKQDMGDEAPKILAPGAPGQQGSSGQSGVSV